MSLTNFLQMLNYHTNICKVKFKLPTIYILRIIQKPQQTAYKVNKNLSWHSCTNTDAEGAQRDIKARALHDPSMTTDEHILLSSATLVAGATSLSASCSSAGGGFPPPRAAWWPAPRPRHGRGHLTREHRCAKPEQDFSEVNRAALRWSLASLLYAGNQQLLLQSEGIV